MPTQSSLRIVEMRVTPIALTDPPLRSAFGLHAPYAVGKRSVFFAVQ